MAGSEDERAAGRTRRQQIAALLAQRAWAFEELREHLQCGVRSLEEDLRHVERSARRGAERLRVTPTRCSACGFEFRDRERRHFHPPSRCPGCKGRDLTPALLRIGDGGGKES